MVCLRGALAAATYPRLRGLPTYTTWFAYTAHYQPLPTLRGLPMRRTTSRLP